MKKRRYEDEGAKKYRKTNKRVQKALKKAKEDWIYSQCKKIDACLNKDNSRKAYQLVKDRISEKRGSFTIIQDKSGKQNYKRILADGHSNAQLVDWGLAAL